MLCVIPHIRKYAKYHLDSENRKQVKNLIKTLFHGLYEDRMDVTQDIFWTKNKDFDVALHAKKIITLVQVS